MAKSNRVRDWFDTLHATEQARVLTLHEASLLDDDLAVSLSLSGVALAAADTSESGGTEKFVPPPVVLDLGARIRDTKG